MNTAKSRLTPLCSLLIVSALSTLLSPVAHASQHWDDDRPGVRPELATAVPWSLIGRGRNACVAGVNVVADR